MGSISHWYFRSAHPVSHAHGALPYPQQNPSFYVEKKKRLEGRRSYPSRPRGTILILPTPSIKEEKIKTLLTDRLVRSLATRQAFFGKTPKMRYAALAVTEPSFKP